MNEKILVTRTSMPPFEEYVDMIKELWDTHWLTNMGKFHSQFEDRLREYLGVEYVSLMVNGHLSLEMAIQALDLPKGGEVITSPFTFISTTHAIVRNGLTPVFCDIKMSDYTIDEEKIEDLITEKTVAIVPIHVYGNICNVEAIEKLAFKYNLKVIYDAAHAFGETVNGVGVGNFGDASTFSFHATKVFNSIEGGAVTFKNQDIYERLYNLKNFGIRGEELVVSVGANAKMNEFAAAMGLCNLKYVAENIALRREKIERYNSELMNEKGIVCQRFDTVGITYSYGYYPVRFDSEYIRNQVYDTLKEHGIHPRKYFYPLSSDAACFKNKYKKDTLENARYVSERILVLPLYPELGCTDIDRICKLIKTILHGEK